MRYTGMTALNAFQNYSPVDKTASDKFSISEGDGPQGLSQYLLYFDVGWRRSRWNHTVVKNISGALQTAAGKTTLEGELTREETEAYIWDFIKQAQTSWSADRCRVHESGDRLETQQEATKRAAEYHNVRSEAVRSNSRKHQVRSAELLISNN